MRALSAKMSFSRRDPCRFGSASMSARACWINARYREDAAWPKCLRLLSRIATRSRFADSARWKRGAGFSGTSALGRDLGFYLFFDVIKERIHVLIGRDHGIVASI